MTSLKRFHRQHTWPQRQLHLKLFMTYVSPTPALLLPSSAPCCVVAAAAAAGRAACASSALHWTAVRSWA